MYLGDRGGTQLGVALFSCGTSWVCCTGRALDDAPSNMHLQLCPGASAFWEG